MSKFGWSYPPGAAGDPNAPWNQEEIEDNTDFEEQFADFDSLFALYRGIYKHTPCGPTLGVRVWIGPKDEPVTYYGDDLIKLGSLKEMRKSGDLIMALYVSSIVEGVDQTTQTYIVEWDPCSVEPVELRKQFWKAVEDCNREAESIWNETHGCPDCAGYDSEFEFNAVDPNCKICGGHGIVI